MPIKKGPGQCLPRAFDYLQLDELIRIRADYPPGAKEKAAAKSSKAIGLH
jgi:hypothetical protein